MCVRDVRRLKPRKWVHRQLDVCDIIVIINSASAMERVKSAYFEDVDKWSSELKNANIIDNVFDIAMEGIMARLQSGHIKDCPSRYAVVTFPHSDSVENLIPYLSTEMNYRLMSDWHSFCMHLNDCGTTCPEMFHDSYKILSSVEGMKLQDSIDNAVSRYSWRDVNTADNGDSTGRNLCQEAVGVDIERPEGHCYSNEYATGKEERLPGNQFDSGFDSHISFNQTETHLQGANDNHQDKGYQQIAEFNHSDSREATQGLLKTHNLPDDGYSLGFIPPSILSSSETLSTNISENAMLSYHNALRKINESNDDSY